MRSKCHTCKNNNVEYHSECLTEIYCKKGHWDIPENPNEKGYNDCWDNCKDYKWNGDKICSSEQLAWSKRRKLKLENLIVELELLDKEEQTPENKCTFDIASDSVKSNTFKYIKDNIKIEEKLIKELEEDCKI